MMSSRRERKSEERVGVGMRVSGGEVAGGLRSAVRVRVRAGRRRTRAKRFSSWQAAWPEESCEMCAHLVSDLPEGERGGGRSEDDSGGREGKW